MSTDRPPGGGVPITTTSGSDSDQDKRLIKFTLYDIKDFLYALAKTPNFLEKIIASDFLDLVGSFRILIIEKKVVERAILESVSILDRLEISDLEAVGMTQDQLQLKSTLTRKVIKIARDFFDNPSTTNHSTLFKWIASHIARGFKRPKVKRVVYWIKKAFGAINTFLGSLKSILPPLEIPEEIKKYLENIMP